MILPDLSFEHAARANGAILICGVDEVGRGPLAGPVTAAAVILCDAPPEGLNDSKQLTPARREVLAEQIMATCIWRCVHIAVEVIDDVNIYQASHRAMREAVAGLASRPHLALIDGPHVPKQFPVPGQAIVKGDALSLSIAAASIVAKVLRDRLMVDLAQQHPGYGWERNAGYGTPEHKRALENLGVTPHHRRSFAPVHNILCKDLTTND